MTDERSEDIDFHHLPENLPTPPPVPVNISTSHNNPPPIPPPIKSDNDSPSIVGPSSVGICDSLLNASNISRRPDSSSSHGSINYSRGSTNFQTKLPVTGQRSSLSFFTPNTPVYDEDNEEEDTFSAEPLSLPLAPPIPQPSYMQTSRPSISMMALQVRKEKEERRVTTQEFVSEMKMLIHFLVVAVEQRKLDPLKISLEKAQDYISKNRITFDEVRCMPAHMEQVGILGSLLEQGEELEDKLVKEAVDGMQYYLKQGLSTKNRVILKETVIKCCHYDRNLFDQELLLNAEKMLKCLDEYHIAKQTLTDAMNSKNDDILNEALSRAVPIFKSTALEGLAGDGDDKLIQDAKKLYNNLSKKRRERELATTSKIKSENKSKSDIIVDKLIGGDIEKITNNFHVIASMESAIVYVAGSETCPIEGVSSPEGGLTVRVDTEDDIDMDALRDSYIKIPVLIYDCIQYMRKHDAVNEPGIFRLAGNRDSMEAILHEYEALYFKSKRRGGIINDEKSLKFKNEASTPSNASSQNNSSISTLSLMTSGSQEQDDEGNTYPSMIYDQLTSVHDAANILKRFLRELGDPLIPHSEYDRWIAVATKCRADPLLSVGSNINSNTNSILNLTSMSSATMIPIGSAAAAAAAMPGGAGFFGIKPPSDPPTPKSSLRGEVSTHSVTFSLSEILEKSVALQQLKDLLSNLSSRRYTILNYLCIFLNRISTNSTVNKMSPDNIAIVFAPNLLKPLVETPQSMVTDSALTIVIISNLIKYATALFAPLNHF